MNGGLFQRSGLSFYEKNCFSTENKLISCLLDIVFLFAGYLTCYIQKTSPLEKVLHKYLYKCRVFVFSSLFFADTFSIFSFSQEK